MAVDTDELQPLYTMPAVAPSGAGLTGEEVPFTPCLPVIRFCPAHGSPKRFQRTADAASGDNVFHVHLDDSGVSRGLALEVLADSEKAWTEEEPDAFEEVAASVGHYFSEFGIEEGTRARERSCGIEDPLEEC
ncbi:hypothetical protein [Georgenia sp. SUBG003]|uniref:hypothetical protein n=1 Tax=Georgenia sp. SUBG003 TaxID=1497974 RepID=UPI0004D448E7|nr:hypothetical protein DA06_16865 [Georgenia sp. SUBG003]